jgi:hypothetical protein
MKKLAIFAAVIALFSCAGVKSPSHHPEMVANIDPFTVGTIDAAFDQTFSTKLKPREINVVFYPRDNTVALEFRHELIGYKQFWNQSAREQFIRALRLYNDDFDAKKLVFQYSKSRAAYGKFKGRLEWATIKITAVHRSSPTIQLGYRFKGDNPYFTVMQGIAKDESGIDERSPPESSSFAIYFTKAQAENLAELFRQEFLLGTVGEYTNQNTQAPSEPEGDVY